MWPRDAYADSAKKELPIGVKNSSDQYIIRDGIIHQLLLILYVSFSLIK